MNRQDTLRNLLVSASVVLFTLYALRTCTPPMPQPGPATTADGTQPVQTTGEPSTTATATQTSGPSEPAAPQTPRFTLEESDTTTITELGGSTEDGPFRIYLKVSNLGGGGLEVATLADHAAELGSTDRYVALRTIKIDGMPDVLSLAVESVSIEGQKVPVSQHRWHVHSSRHDDTTHEVTYSLDVLDGGVPAVRILRTLSLAAQPREGHHRDIRSDIRVENLTDREYRVGLAYLGGLGIERTNPRMDDRCVTAGLEESGLVRGSTLAVSKIVDHQNTSMFDQASASGGERLSWAATCNTYFTCTVAPRSSDSAQSASYIAKIEAVDLDRNKSTDHDTAIRFVVMPQPLAAGLTRDYPCEVYIGEKDSHGFQKVEPYASRNYYYQIQSGFGSCTFTWLVKLMIWLLNSLYAITLDFGLAIVILVLIVRVLLHPVTKKGQVNMVRMQKVMGELAPKMEEIKKKFANDKAKMQQELMALQTREGISPFGQILTCIPLLIQMPIWFALYMSLYNNILMRHEPLLYGLTWIDDLTAQDALITFASPVVVPIFGWELPSFNLLPILLSITMYTQQKLQPKPKPNPNMTDQQRAQQEMMQKMMPMMSIMMLLIFYKMPSGLNLYIMASSLIGTVEQYRIRKHIREHEEAGTLLKKPTPKPVDPGKRKPPGFLARLQAMAEEAQKAQPKRRDKKR